MQALTIGKVAKHAGVGIDTVRFYERKGVEPGCAERRCLAKRFTSRQGCFMVGTE
ncbi:MAG: MerR family DNA-binding transcriptional regulator [Candidatus Tectomicrobia bacterium]|nr:MerR family DNA-binding transcriptional regulator [Candidatus Tectomicrobia bacterium]